MKSLFEKGQKNETTIQVARWLTAIAESADFVCVQENLAYIPLSSLIILLVILLTCASRRKKVDAFNAIERSLENDVKEEYAIMCFPCLKKKPDIKNFEPVEDLSDQFEYIVEKYTVRKVPLLLANTVEDIIERQEELGLASGTSSQPKLNKDDFVNFQVTQEMYNIQRIPPCITVAANVSCPAKKVLKERAKPSDILESMSPINRPPINNNNYVVIPTKGSLRRKDIMMTKREITNQYLNNFSSVFVDNLKDQVPKDPEQYPSLSRPYTSAFKTFPINDKQTGKLYDDKKSRKGKKSKVAYTYPVKESDNQVDSSVKEEPSTDSDSIQDQTTEAPDSLFQEEEGVMDEVVKEKSLVLLKDSDSAMFRTESLPNPFKTTIKSSVFENDENPCETDELSSFTPEDEWPVSKNVTYEDIQALDVGYEFTSCEKLGVKPKMTRIPYPIETEKFKESLKLAFGDTSKVSKKSYSQDHALAIKSIKAITFKPPVKKSEPIYFNDVDATEPEETPLKAIVTETSFLSNLESLSKTDADSSDDIKDLEESTTTLTKGKLSNTQFIIDADLNEEATVDSITEISNLYNLTMPGTHSRENPTPAATDAKTVESGLREPMPSKSRSFQERSGPKMNIGPEVKGNSNKNQNSAQNQYLNVGEPETETTCSLYSHDSKTSSAVTTGLSSEVDEGKRATLRWKIVIKHHREDDFSKKNVNTTAKH